MTTSLHATALAKALRARLPATHLHAPSSEHSVDGFEPALVVAPSTQAGVATVLAVADELGAVVLPRGGGTQTGLGMPPERYDVALDLHRLDALVEHEPADLTVTVEAGLRLAELQRLLSERGQWLPLDPGLPEQATIGGILATNASGPARCRHGSARDLLIGLTVALPNGDLVKSGGRVVKNVAGYDLGKLHIGALGTLGVITQASFKVAPLAPHTVAVRINGSLDQLTRLAESLIEARLSLLGLCLCKQAGQPDWTLGARFAGGAAAVDRSQHEAMSLAKDASLNAEAREDAAWTDTLTLPSASLVAKASVLPAALSRVAIALASAGASLVAYPGVGVLHASWPAPATAETLQALRQLCVAMGGAFVLESAPVELKRAAGVWGEPRSGFALMQQIKQQFDPNRVLNRGRYLGGI